MKKQITIYHNPSCSKSRECLQWLESCDQEVQIIEYLKAMPSEDDLLKIIDQLEGEVSSIVRTDEDDFKKAKFDTSDRKLVAKNLAKNPRLIQRPIVIVGKKAVIGRPLDAIKKIFE